MKNVDLEDFRLSLFYAEKSAITISKYLRDVRTFLTWVGDRELSKGLMIQWKDSLSEAQYSPRSINSMLASVNSYLRFIGREDCRVRQFTLQKRAYTDPEEELTWAEYLRLLKASERKPRLHAMLETFCATGIRVSELKFFTVQAVRKRKITIYCKSKFREIMLQRDLQKLLLDYARARGIQSGPIFRTRSGKPVNRCNIWAEMKALCKEAGVSPRKVYPHNLRKLFARKYYRGNKDLAKLADLLGHSKLDTTRIYIIASGEEHMRQLESLKLVV